MIVWIILRVVFCYILVLFFLLFLFANFTFYFANLRKCSVNFIKCVEYNFLVLSLYLLCTISSIVTYEWQRRSDIRFLIDNCFGTNLSLLFESLWLVLLRCYASFKVNSSIKCAILSYGNVAMQFKSYPCVAMRGLIECLHCYECLKVTIRCYANA